MAVQTSYPGVYVQEVPSGVRTITGVSTSITAFIGTAKRGPINRAVTITSFVDYERKFGGLSSVSEMSFAVKQFFLNGGTQGIVVRVASNPVTASATLDDNSTPANNVLQITAADQGSEGNRIEVRINYQTSNRDSLFNLVVNYSTIENPSQVTTEVHSNLSMNSMHPRYVQNIVEADSSFIRATRVAAAALIAGLLAGTSQSAPIIGDVGTLLGPMHNRLRVMIDSLDPIDVQLVLPADLQGGPNTPARRLINLCTAIRTKVRAQANGQPAVSNFTCAPNGDRIIMTSGVAGEDSRVQVLPGVGNDAAAPLGLGIDFGGSEIDGAAAIRPAQVPLQATWTSNDIISTDITSAPSIPDVTVRSFRIRVDGAPPVTITIPTTALVGVTHALRMSELANIIQTAIRAFRPSSPAFRDFTVDVIPGVAANSFQFVFGSGTRGSTSSVEIIQEAGDPFVTRLFLLVDGSPTTAAFVQATDVMLQGGTELPVTAATAFAVYTGSQGQRTGLYSLESTDLFNLLCVPGITDPGILTEYEAYCRARRAFFIVDSPPLAIQPDQMQAIMFGTTLPKSDHAAVFYPWTRVPNPITAGQQRLTAPSGTVAGIFARTDANRGVWKAPAGTEAKLVGVRRLEYMLTDTENGILNPLAVNCLRTFPDPGIISWGSRTLAGSDANASEWKYIPVRRTALFIEESLYRGLKWVVFEPNDEPLWGQIRLNVGSFMHNLFRQGAFQGIKKSDAYFVKCDSETTTQNDINLGRVNIWVGFAPLKPAEFVILYLQQMAGNIQV